VTLPASPRLKRHATHQAGRDVDVSFYYNQLGIIYSPHEPVYPPAINGDPASTRPPAELRPSPKRIFCR